MSNTAQIALIVTVAVVIVLYIFRRQLAEFMLKFNKDGLETKLTTHAPDAPKPAPATPAAPAPASRPVVIKGNVQEGADHVIDVRRGDVEVIENLQDGDRQEIVVGPDES